MPSYQVAKVGLGWRQEDSLAAGKVVKVGLIEGDSVLYVTLPWRVVGVHVKNQLRNHESRAHSIRR